MGKFYNEGQIFNDSQDLLQEDLQNIVTDGQADSAGRMVASAAEDTGIRVMGIASGLVLTATNVSIGSAKITVGIGTAYDYDGMLMESDGTIQLTGVVPADVGSYIYLSGVEADDATSTRQNYVGKVSATRRIINCTLAKNNSAPPALVGNGIVNLGKISAWSAGDYPIFSDIANVTVVAGVVLYAGTAITPVYGDAGNNYYYWFEAQEGGVSPTISYYQSTLNTASHYLKIKIPTLAGTPICTYDDIAAVLLSTAVPYNLSGGGTSVFAGSYNTGYVNFTTGNDYRQYYQTKVGSYSLADTYRLSPNDPYTQHLGYVGRGIPTTVNPHGQLLTDLDNGSDIIALQEHRRKEHTFLSGIDKGATNLYLASTFVVASDTVIVRGVSSSTRDRAVVNGKAVTSIVNMTSAPDYGYQGTASDPILYEFGMADTGAIYAKPIASYGATSANSLFGASGGGYCYLVIVDKHPLLNNIETVSLTSDGTATTFSAKVGTGNSVDVTTTNIRVRLYDQDGYWVDVVREFYAGIGASTTYDNTVAFAYSELTTDLPSASIFWRGSAGTGFNAWGFNNLGTINGYIEKRVYGTDSMRNDQFGQLGDSLDYGLSYYSNIAGYMTNQAGTVLTPFKVSYRGVDYNFDKQAISGIMGIAGAGNYFIVQRFTDNSTWYLKNYNASTVALTNLATQWNKETDVLLGYLVWSGAAAADGTMFPKQTCIHNNSYNYIRVGATGWLIDDALCYVETVQRAFPATTFVLEFVSNVTNVRLARSGMGLGGYNISKLIIKGNNFTWTGENVLFTGHTTINATGTGASIKIFDCNFGNYISFWGSNANGTEEFIFERCSYIATVYNIGFINPGATLSAVRLDKFSQLITVAAAGVNKLVNVVDGTSYVLLNDPAYIGSHVVGTDNYVVYVNSGARAIVQENGGEIAYGDYYSNDGSLLLKKTSQVWVTDKYGVYVKSTTTNIFKLESYNTNITFDSGTFLYGTISNTMTEFSLVVNGGTINGTPAVAADTDFMKIVGGAGIAALGCFDIRNIKAYYNSTGSFSFYNMSGSAFKIDGAFIFKNNYIEGISGLSNFYISSYNFVTSSNYPVVLNADISDIKVVGGTLNLIMQAGDDVFDSICLSNIKVNPESMSGSTIAIKALTAKVESVHDVKEIKITAPAAASTKEVNYLAQNNYRSQRIDNSFIIIDLTAATHDVSDVLAKGNSALFATVAGTRHTIVLILGGVTAYTAALQNMGFNETAIDPADGWNGNSGNINLP